MYERHTNPAELMDSEPFPLAQMLLLEGTLLGRGPSQGEGIVVVSEAECILLFCCLGLQESLGDRQI